MPQPRLRVLHLSTELPHPSGGSGGAVRQFHLLHQLAARGHQVTSIAPVFAFQLRDLDPVAALADSGIRLVPTRRRAPREREAIDAFIRRPALLARAAHVPFYGLQMEMLALEMREPIRQELARGVDVVLVDHDTSVYLSDLLPADVPKILTLHNITPRYYELRARQSAGLSGLLNRREAFACRRYITPRLERFDLLVTVSEADAALIRGRVKPPIAVVPNGTDAQATTPAPPRTEGPPSLLFTGTMNHPPNHEGIVWFHREIWPRIVAEVPDVRLVVVGRHPQESVLALANADARIQVTGGVPTMGPYYADATIAIAPLQSGSGTRLKVLDALSAERAMVTTAIGCEGIDVVHDTHVLIGDTPDEFARHTVALLRDAPRRAALAAAGRQLAIDRYDWASLGTSFGELVESTVTREASASLG